MDMTFWNNLANLKYAVLQQNANSDALRAKGAYASDTANAGLTQARAAVLPRVTNADIAQTQAQTNLLDKQGDWYGREAAARVGLLGAQAANQTAGAGLYDAQAKDITAPLPGAIGDAATSAYANLRQRLGLPAGYAKGTARVPGNGSGKTDTVPAKLAPGEAVLNKSAADTMGRGLIAALNAHGAAKMGLS